MKHVFDIFAGTERLASAIGNGGIASIGTHIVDNNELARKHMERDAETGYNQ